MSFSALHLERTPKVTISGMDTVESMLLFENCSSFRTAVKDVWRRSWKTAGMHMKPGNNTMQTKE